MRRLLAGLSLAVVAAIACTNAGEHLTVPALVNGGIQRLRVCTRCNRSNKVVKAGPSTKAGQAV